MVLQPRVVVGSRTATPRFPAAPYWAECHRRARFLSSGCRSVCSPLQRREGAHHRSIPLLTCLWKPLPTGFLMKAAWFPGSAIRSSTPPKALSVRDRHLREGLRRTRRNPRHAYTPNPVADDGDRLRHSTDTEADLDTRCRPAATGVRTPQQENEPVALSRRNLAYRGRYRGSPENVSAITSGSCSSASPTASPLLGI